MPYLRLFHGRNDPDQNMEDWGEDGPVFGPLEFVHTTYSFHLKLGLSDDNCYELYCFEDMLYYDGVYYGDWSVFTEECFRENNFQTTVYESSKAQIPQS